MFEKLASTTIKDMLIAKVVEQTSFDIDIIEKVVSFQGEDLIKSLNKCSQVEISGFGVLFVSKTKLKNRMSSYIANLTKGGTPEYNDIMEKEIEFLKTK